MEIKSSYPKPAKKSKFMEIFRLVCGLLFAISSVASVVVNLSVGGKPWSIVVVWSIYIAYSLLFTPLIEYNLINSGLMLTLRLSILLLFIDLFLAGGWAKIVIPIIISAAFLTLCIIFFSRARTRRGHMLPLILALLCSTVLSAAYLVRFGAFVPIIVLCALSFALLVASVAVMGKFFTLEVRKYFHLR
jgi:hypothetical protein